MQAPKIRENLPAILILGGTILLAFLGGRYVAYNAFSFTDIIFVIIFFFALSVALSGARGFKVGVIGGILALILGYRTVQVQAYINLHPAELIIWGLAALMLAQYITRKVFEVSWWLPKWVIFMVPFWIWAWIMTFIHGNFIGDAIREFRNFIIIIPMFGIFSTILKDRSYWRTILTTFYITGSLISFLGVFSFIFPGISSRIPGFSSLPATFMMPDGFNRATYGFWGSPAAVFILILSLPMMFILLKWWRKPYQIYLIYFGAILHLFGVYIGGYRSVWLFMGIQIVVWVIARKGVLIGLYLLLPLVLLVRFVPQSAQERMATLYAVLEGHVVDSSAEVRLTRLNFAIESILWQPLGGGWGYAGWVHNDILQIAANVGVPAALIFIYGWVSAFVKLIKGFLKTRGDKELNTIYFVFLLSMSSVMLLFVSQGVLVLPQFSLPVWYVWVLAEIFIQQKKISVMTSIS